MDARKTYLTLINRVANDKIPMLGPLDIVISPGAYLPIGTTGFTSRRWVRYCDQYLKGGPAFESFLAKRRGIWQFTNDAGHTKGACIKQLEIGSKIKCESRAMLFSPTGILDFKFLAMCANRLHRPVTWHIDEVNFSYEFMVGVAHLMPRTGGSWLKEFKSRYKLRASKFRRHIRLYNGPRIVDETMIENGFTYAILRDFTWIYGKGRDGWKEDDSLFRRILHPWHRGEWVFNDIPREMRKVLSKHIPDLPTLNQIATDRSARLSKAEGSSSQSQTIGYTNRRKKC